MTDSLLEETPTALKYANEIVSFLNERYGGEDTYNGYLVLKALAMVSRRILAEGNNSQVEMLLTPYEIALECFRKEDKELEQEKKRELAKLRPVNYDNLSSEEQWKVDKQLGILDWNGK